MCVCASDSGTADFREGLLAGGPSLTQINALSRARAHEHAAQTRARARSRSVTMWVFVWVLGFACEIADGDELLTCVYGR